MREPLREPRTGSTPAGAPPQAGALAHPAPALASLAMADVATRARLATAIQRSAGNQALARALLREPVAEAPVAATADPAGAADKGLVPMLEAFWPDDAWTAGRLAMDLMRPIPALGFVTGVAADVMAAWDDMADVPTREPVVHALTETLIVFRSGLNIVSNGAESLLELGQIAQWVLGTMTVSEGVGTITVPVVGPVTVPAAIVSGLGTLGTLAVNQGIGAVVAGTSGTLAAIDVLITLDAGIWAAIGPEDDRDDWAKLGWGYVANTISDAVTMLVALAGEGSLNLFPSGPIATAIDSLTALLKYAQVPRKVITGALAAFWNVQGGDVLEHAPRPAPADDGGLEPGEPQQAPGSEIGFGSLSAQAPGAVELAAMRACFERGDAVLTSAQSDWAALVEAGVTMAADSGGASDAVAELREQLPAIAGDLESRLATAEDIAGRVGGGVEAVEAFQAQLDALVATVGGLSLPLDELADDAAGTALRTVLEPVASALEAARTTAIPQLLELQQSAQSLRTLLDTVARVAEESIGLYRDALDRTVAAVAECDNVSELITALAEESAALGSAGEGVEVDATLEDWRALGAEIAAAEAAL
jgi:hypothetical protein